MPESKPCGCGCVNTFSTGEAEDDLKRYLKQGPDATTLALIDAIRAEGIEGASLLDVGGGIGTIQLELLAGGLGSAESVDATEAYVEVARAEAERRGFSDRTVHRFGTLVDIAGEVAPADIVTLDKVVCCDPNLAELLEAVTARANRMVGLIYPRVTWWNRLAARTFAVWGRVTRDRTRWHLHPESQVDGPLRRAGFERRDVDRTFIWQVALYVRPAGATSAAASTRA
jgi:hypothetical protein